ncbi:Sugar phosphate isomerase/epimerase [Robiginitalea myxolifaciens]|uniref:Sugar phosphate isomerase/epimerase n=1 Tax=Robiginitalea myxolifaciens TaxID=400055 RepID=A0A1I6FMR4_9FLAO|nr:sugar phosphate isomerase/epimerase [Robiginitalea myxolifaciens]SFR31255.1 Sugar phosphate isomerase/epimerase [Robiginitalea myxolifaciens]
MKRKDFLKTSGLAATSLGFLPGITRAAISHQGPYSPLRALLYQKLNRIGIQLFSCPKLMEADPAEGLKILAEMGYSEIELYGPYPISAQSNKERWASLVPMLGFSGSGYFEKSRNDFKILANELGLRIPSLHTDLDSLENKLPALAQEARSMGATYVVLPAIPDDKRQTLDDYKRMAETFNSIGSEARDLGIRFAYHNHGYGLQEQDGVIPFDTLIEATDPELVFLEMDIFWTVAGRANPVEYLRKYANRYKLMHLKDMVELKYFSGDGGDATQWMELWPLMASTGTGVLDLEAIIDTALAGGVEHFFVEQDLVANPETALKTSHDYLNAL